MRRRQKYPSVGGHDLSIERISAFIEKTIVPVSDVRALPVSTQQRESSKVEAALFPKWEEMALYAGYSKSGFRHTRLRAILLSRVKQSFKRD
jgi:hypothetical protein